VKKTTTAPVHPPLAKPKAPEFIRLPKPGTQCPYTGMTRGALNLLLLPTRHNNFKPEIRSFVLRQKGARTGIRLIDYASLRRYILAHLENGAPHK
jgi:hypothetical protein